MKDKLWCDMQTDSERVEFLRSGRAWETGIIAQAIVEEVADVFAFRFTASQQTVQSDGLKRCHVCMNLGYTERFCYYCGREANPLVI